MNGNFLCASLITVLTCGAALAGEAKPPRAALPPYSEIVERVQALEDRLARMDAETADRDRRLAELERESGAQEARIAALESENADQELRLVATEQLLRHFSLVDLDPALDDDLGNPEETLRISGANLQVVNGLGTTDTMNGLGNIVIGYNEVLSTRSPGRGGSHYLLVGWDLGYERFGGIVAGQSNTGTGQFASAVGGESNDARGWYSVVVGGRANVTGDMYTTGTGGLGNRVGGFYSTITGGEFNEVGGRLSSISWGRWMNLRDDYHWAAGSLRSW